LRLVLSPSASLAAALVALHAAAALSAFLVIPGLAGAAIAVLLLLLGAAAAWSRALLRARRSPRALEIRGDSFTLELAGGARLEMPRPPRCYVSRLAVILPSQSILVAADMLPREEFRRLRVWALWGRLPAVAGKQLPA
jgi:hypothetical protein